MSARGWDRGCRAGRSRSRGRRAIGRGRRSEAACCGFEAMPATSSARACPGAGSGCAGGSSWSMARRATTVGLALRRGLIAVRGDLGRGGRPGDDRGVDLRLWSGRSRSRPRDEARDACPVRCRRSLRFRALAHVRAERDVSASRPGRLPEAAPRRSASTCRRRLSRVTIRRYNGDRLEGGRGEILARLVEGKDAMDLNARALRLVESLRGSLEERRVVEHASEGGGR